MALAGRSLCQGLLPALHVRCKRARCQAGSGPGDAKLESQRQAVSTGEGPALALLWTCQGTVILRLSCFWLLPLSGDRHTTQPWGHRSCSVHPCCSGTCSRKTARTFTFSASSHPLFSLQSSTRLSPCLATQTACHLAQAGPSRVK